MRWMIAAALCLLAPWARAQEFFEKRVRPVLAQSCVGCHSGPNAEAGLRLDSAAGVQKGGPRGRLLGAEGTLLRAIAYTDPTLRMPPSGRLPEEQRKDLETWVKSGGFFPASKTPEPGARPAEGIDLKERRKHWAYQPVKFRLAPPIEGARTDIDAFVLAKLARKGLGFSRPADRRTLLRRLSYDLTGLPPTPEETRAFVGDSSPDAYEKQVDRLLASPHYGERWARHWLDLVRYGESMGHELDFELPQAWMYRDWVVRALNADVPYNDFLTEQIAGDLLERPRLNSQTGWNESLIATGFWWLGEGKHSPVDIKQEQADRIDNQIDVLGKAVLGQTLACARCHDHKFDPIPTKDYYGLYGILASSRFQLTSVSDAAPFEKAAKAIAALRPPPTGAVRGDGGPLDFTRWKPSGTAFATLARPGEAIFVGDEKNPAWDTCARLTAHSAWGGRRQEGALRSPTFTLDTDFLHLRVRGVKGRLHLVIEGFQVMRDPICGPLQHTIDNPRPYWITIDLRLWKGRRAYIELADSPMTNLSLGPLADPAKPFYGWLACDAVARSNEPKPPTLSDPAMPAPETDTARMARQIAALEEGLPVAARAMAMCDGPDGSDESVFVRGNHRASGPTASRLALALCGREGGAPAPAGSGRRELARALTDPNHPLVARVLVNRLWKHHFGAGLVPTPDDLGHMGERPTHPELLDYLARELVTGGWSLKALHKKMLLTDAYRQSSALSSPAVEVKDPTNALLHRANIRRLEGEAIRDSLLAVSGRLDRKQGGPSIFLHLTEFVEGRGRPPQGPLDGDGRRSIYLAVRRNFLSPWLQAFDFPTPFTCIGKRSVSNVPAQALAMMNGPLVRQQARLWAERVVKELPGASERIAAMYESAFARPPSAEEAAAAQEFIAGREGDVNAWADLAHVLFNLKEFVFVP